MKQHSSCPVCGGNHFQSVRKPQYFRGKPETFNIDECANCGFWFTNPFPEGEALAAYYESDDYVSHTDGKGGLMDRVYGIVRNRAIRSKFNLVKGLAAPKEVLVDYGAGTGEFLKYAQDQHWQVKGFEPSSVARTNASVKGLELIDPQEREDLEEESVGVFSLWHVLEHIPDLNETMAYFHSRLMSQGYLVLALPNHESADADHYQSDWAAFDIPLHLWHFSKVDVKALGEKHGFHLESVHNMPFDSFYVSLLSEKNRSGSSRLISAFWQGLMSNLKGGSAKNMSSLIYVLKKV